MDPVYYVFYATGCVFAYGRINSSGYAFHYFHLISLCLGSWISFCLAGLIYLMEADFNEPFLDFKNKP